MHFTAATTARPRGPQVLPVYPSSLVTATNMVLDDDVTQCGLVLADADPGPQSFEQHQQTMLIALTLGAQNTPPNAQQQHLSATTTIDLSDAAQSNVQIVSGLGHQVNMVLSCPGCTAPRCGTRMCGLQGGPLGSLCCPPSCPASGSPFTNPSAAAAAAGQNAERRTEEMTSQRSDDVTCR